MVKFDALRYKYPSRRGVVYGRRGMVCTSQNLAAEAGLDMLKKGGNAIDAAIAAAACLAVTEPMANGLGSDAFALVWKAGKPQDAANREAPGNASDGPGISVGPRNSDGPNASDCPCASNAPVGPDAPGKLYGLNASGPAPMLAEPAVIRQMGFDKMPERGMIPVTVPGAVASWAALSEGFGRLPFEELLEPAIGYAEEGFPVSPVTARAWQTSFEELSGFRGLKEFDGWFSAFAPEGRAPECGEIWKSRELADSLRKIAQSKGEVFYRGELAEKIDRFSSANTGFIRKEDMEAYSPECVEPIKVNYKGFDVWEMPPNGHGIVALMALNIMNKMEFKERDCVDTFHRQIEAMKLAFADGKRYVTDPRYMKVTAERLLSEDYADERRSLIGEKAMQPEPGRPDRGGTVYLCTADEEGNMVSFIQSCYWSFGSGMVVPGTGICLQNRGANFYLDESMENCIGPGKKPYHTIIPSFLTKDGRAIGPFGVMGAFMQPQGHVQVVSNTVDFHMNPQEALDAPRWQWVGDKEIWVERGFPYAVTEELERRGHRVAVKASFSDFGKGQIIWRTKNGAYVGATEPRGDGCVAAW